MKILALAAMLMLAGLAARAAGVDSRTMNCAGLHSLIAEHGFLFIGQPAFGDFAVANGRYCSAGQYVQLRSVPTLDAPECLINYCNSSNAGGWGW
jgi:hypothetical protein